MMEVRRKNDGGGEYRTRERTSSRLVASGFYKFRVHSAQKMDFPWHNATNLVIFMELAYKKFVGL